ncbi:MAG: TadE/TadG family type IV pilus assembly protein [Myxococcota bacterium]
MSQKSTRQGKCLQKQRGQSAVETMFMIPIMLLVFMGMYELFTITFATQNAHIRAREYLLHDGAYVSGAPAGEPGTTGDSVFDSGARNYRIADPATWGVTGAASGSSNAKGFASFAHDQGIAGISDAGGGNAQFGGREGVYVRANAYICSPIGCPSSAR